MSVNLSVSIGQYSHRGVKADNQDFYGVMIPQEPLLSNKGICAVIADGVSSSEFGKQASESCVGGFLSDYFSTPESWTVKTSTQKVLTAINRWLYSKGQQQASPSRGMVTTLSTLILKSTSAYIFHVGDSRIYRIQDDAIECLTNDHRVWVSKDENYLSRAMGIDIHLDIDYRSVALEAGDIFILTTDGVHDFINEKTITELIKSNISNLEVAAKSIVDKALENKSDDNVTCQVIRVDSLPSQAKDDVYKSLTKLPFPPDLAKDMVLDGFRILSEIHASKRTQVYKAVDIDSGNTVVLKTPSVNFEDDATYIENFIREEWVGKRIKNKHVVNIYPQSRQRQCLYYVTEYVNGQTLGQWIREHPHPEINEVRQIIKQIAQGLRGFHRLEMLHQDLKPDNILLDANGQIKIIDFGSTKIAGIAEITTPIERVNMLGTVNYTAPEYLLGLPGSNRSDLFSLGVICYELLTGKLPYGDQLEKAKDEKAVKQLHYISSCKYNPMIPTWLDRAIKKAVHPDYTQRYELLSEFIHDISQPNPAFLKESATPIIERNPLAFWRGFSLVMVIINLILILLFLKN